MWFLSIIALVLVLSGSSPAYAEDKPSQHKLRFGYFPISFMLPVYVAQEKGYFAANGLQVTMTEIASSPSILAAMAAGQLDAGSMSFVSTVLAGRKGVPVKLLGSFGYSKVGHAMNGLYVLKNSAIRNVEDLSGKKIAGNMKGTEPWFWIMDSLATRNVSNYRYIELGPSDLSATLKAGTVDASFLMEPLITMMGTEVRPLIDLGNVQGACGYAFTNSYVASNPDAVKKWFKSLAAGIGFIRENSGEARTILAKYTRVPLEVAKRASLPAWDEQSRILIDEAGREVKWMKKYGLVREDPDLNKVFDYRFTDKIKLTDLK
jgi:NitT/TauT family transport system substrate-binding protein